MGSRRIDGLVRKCKRQAKWFKEKKYKDIVDLLSEDELGNEVTQKWWNWYEHKTWSTKNFDRIKIKEA